MESEQEPESLPVTTESESVPMVIESEPAPVSESESVPEPESVPHPALVDEPVPVPESSPEPEPVSESVSQPEPTLEELKALLLACDSLVQLQQLKREHLQTLTKAYDSMTEKEQARVDAIAALAVPHRVFKYLGDTIVQGSSRLLKGTLVYIDPQTQLRANAYSAPVWAINGVSSGWQRPVSVSQSLLKEVVKAALPEQEHDGGQQMGLI